MTQRKAAVGTNGQVGLFLGAHAQFGMGSCGHVKIKLERDMAITTGFQHQQPLGWSAAVRSAPSPQHGAHLELKSEATRASTKPAMPPEEKSLKSRLKR